MKYTIEQARILGGFTQVEIAKRLGMSEKTYIQYEKYRKVFRMDTAMKFVSLTKVKINEIIFFKDQLQKICSG
ncbi:helix-turn-helix transcriptional regulator [Cytobacillus depressus]|uniref:Helix-turn-helix transcriptional regulator n=1 Tax=Cytobacillus depressus TaxID=1602942 RepID=A0A6L3VEM5_9BACI|nr:helix-turn-helix transcriptional regulator [Cytobacillus depressus]KAB2337621.1 helix-turn-helix transcriptional regulator [Cytobacillus depressus]